MSNCIFVLQFHPWSDLVLHCTIASALRHRWTIRQASLCPVATREKKALFLNMKMVRCCIFTTCTTRTTIECKCGPSFYPLKIQKEQCLQNLQNLSFTLYRLPHLFATQSCIVFSMSSYLRQQKGMNYITSATCVGTHSAQAQNSHFWCRFPIGSLAQTSHNEPGYPLHVVNQAFPVALSHSF